MELFPYQVEGAAFLASHGRALLADEMGLGKSAQAIAACDAVDAFSVLVICPASVVENWKREFAKFSKTGITPIVTSYNKADSLRTMTPDVWDVLILDEAHYLKSPKAKRTQAIFGPKCDGKGGLVSDAKHVFCLTGTPTPNNPSELWPMLRAVMPGAIERDNGKPMPLWPFISRYCVTRDNGFGIQIVKGKNLDELKSRIAPFVLRRKKTEVLKDLPPIRFDTLALQPHGDLPVYDGEMYEIVAKALAAHGVEGLKAIAPHVASLRRVTGMAKVAPAVEWIKEQFDAGLEKLVVFAHHRDVVDQLTVNLQPYGCVALTGGTLPAMRQHVVDEFQRNLACRVFIGQILAAGTGITLTAASDVLFVESSWVPAENEQAAMRIHRIGQRNACMVRFATLAGSIDEDIQRAVMRKTADITKLFG